MTFYGQCVCTVVVFSLPYFLAYIFRLPSFVTITCYVILFLYLVVLPLAFHFILFLQRFPLYMFYLGRPEPGTLERPELSGLKNTRNFYVKNGDISLGVWHVLPASYEEKENRSAEEYEKSLSDGSPIVYYVHGNMGCRNADYRVDIYKILAAMNYHVVVVDFRCFGDSKCSTWPHEEAVAEDAYTVAQWIYQHSGDSPVFIYGHSLGSGFAARISARLIKSNKAVHGLIMEAPFPDMASEIKVHPFGTILRHFPWYEPLMVNVFYSNGEEFTTAKYVQQLPSPVLILHAEDDNVIPSCLGERLYEIVERSRPPGSGPTIKVIFEKSKKYGHSGIYTAPEYPSIIGNFIEKYKKEQYAQ